jgi:aspartyl-tRNA(Asn)/glutamyl-tRNA(Gln) amidotransferase subunit C
MKSSFKFNTADIDHISKLANIPVSPQEKSKLAQGFNSVIEIVNKLFKLDVKKVEPTHQVTGLYNIFREDEIDENKMFSQTEALQNANNTHEGYFVVSQILEE